MNQKAKPNGMTEHFSFYFEPKIICELHGIEPGSSSSKI
jgi:hypothetical protein